MQQLMCINNNANYYAILEEFDLTHYSYVISGKSIYLFLYLLRLKAMAIQGMLIYYYTAGKFHGVQFLRISTL